MTNIDIHLEFGPLNKIFPISLSCARDTEGSSGILHLTPTLAEKVPANPQPWEKGFGVVMLPKSLRSDRVTPEFKPRYAIQVLELSLSMTLTWLWSTVPSLGPSQE